MKQLLSGFYAFVFVALLALGATTKNVNAKASTIPAAAFIGAIPMRKGDSRRAIFTKLNEDFPGKNIAPAYIRAEAYLANGQQSYTFPLYKLGTDLAIEEKLNQQDAFCITDVGIFLMKELTSTPGIGKLLTYPATADFPDETSPALQNAHLEVVYNGRLVFKVGETTYLPDLPTKDCRVRRTDVAERLPGDGLIPLVPTYTLKGRENNEITLVIPANANQYLVSATTGGTAYKSKVVLFLEGFKIVGAGGASMP